MLRRRLGALIVFALALALPTAAQADRPIPDQYIVVLHDGTDASAVAAEHKRKAGANVLDTYGAAIDGYTARLSASELRKVKADPRVDYVTQDVEGVPIEAQTLPPGINRIDADISATAQLAGDGSGTVPGDVAVYDTGIQSNHPDLNVAGGVNCLGTDPYQDGTINDQFGHGTHIAGTIGAKDDANGVVGVAPGVRLWSVRVLNRLASGSTSSQLCGVDWLTANGPGLGIKVVNSSMRMFTTALDDQNCGLTRPDVIHQAICRLSAAGILWVNAAGNTNADYAAINGPTYDEALTVTAMGDNNGTPNVGSTATFTCSPASTSTKKQKPYSAETDDKYTSFSSFAVNPADQAHTIAAPGACIYSTFLNSTYGYMSGTSMAAPHAVGVAHLCIVSGQCTGTTAEIIQKLRADAAAYTQASPGWGFTGDPLRPVSGRYYGFLTRAGLY